MNLPNRIRIEAEAILADPEIQRAPAQTRILRYLADRAHDGSAGISQYEIATQALGRRTDFDESTDSVVRVQVGRLRKRMAEHYRRLCPDDDMYLYIRPGEYRLRLGPAHLAYPELSISPVKFSAISQTEPQEERIAPGITGKTTALSGKLALLGACLAILVQAVLFANLVRNRDKMGDVQLAELTAPPLVAGELRIAEELAQILPEGRFREDIANDIDRVLQMSLISRSQVGSAKDVADYVIYTLLTKGVEPGTMNVFVTMRDKAGYLIGSKSLSRVKIDESAALVPQLVISLISPTGRLSGRLAEQIKGPPANGYECYLLVENYHSRSAEYLGFLDSCMAQFGQSPYRPTLEARQLIHMSGESMIKGGTLSKTSPLWIKLDALLARNPDNAYANALATKMLIGLGECDQAMGFARQGYSQGHIFPTLEISAIVDAYGCPEDAISHDALDRRVQVMLAADRDTDSPVLRVFLLLGAILSDQKAAQASLVGLKSSWDGAQDLEKFNSAVGRKIDGTATKQDIVLIKAVLSQLVWNQYARWQIRRKLGIA